MKLIEECENLFEDLCDNFPNSKAIKLFKKRENLFNEFYLVPASTYYHGNFVSGLFCHSVKVTFTALDIAETQFPELDSEQVVTVALLHDIGKIGVINTDCKIVEPYYRITDDGFKPNKKIPDHTLLGLFNLQRLGIKLSFNEFCAIAGHNGAYVDGFKHNFGNGKESPLLLCLHWADLKVSRFENI